MTKISARKFIENITRLSPVELAELQAQVTWDINTNRPIIGFALAVKPKERDVTKAQDIVTFLQDRRVLYRESEWEHVAYCIESVMKIREELVQLRRNTNSDSPLHKYAENMRNGCIEFLEMTEKLEKSESGYYVYRTDNYRIFQAALGRIRRVFARQLLNLSIAYDVDIDEHLASIVPISDNHDPSLLEETWQEQQKSDNGQPGFWIHDQ